MKLSKIFVIVAIIVVAAILVAPIVMKNIGPQDDRTQLTLVTFTPTSSIRVGDQVTQKFYVQDQSMIGTAQTMVGGPRINVQLVNPGGIVTMNRTLNSDWYAVHSDGLTVDMSGTWLMKYTPVTSVDGYKNPATVVKQIVVVV